MSRDSRKLIWLPFANQALFLLFFSLVMLSYAQQWDHGPFTWWGVPITFPSVDESRRVGPLALLPGLVLLGTLGDWLVNRPHRRWSWGDRRVFWPLLGVTVLTLYQQLRLFHEPVVVSLLLFWVSYLFMVNDSAGRDSVQLLPPRLVDILALIVVVQAAVGIAQFVMQSDLGLDWLGEPALDPQVPGVSVVSRDGVRWLRAYGLNSHPSRLGLKLMTFFILLWPCAESAPNHGRRHLIRLALILAGAGLFVSLARSAWLGLAAGVGVYALSWAVIRFRRGQFPSISPSRLRLALILIVVVLLFTAFYGDALVGRITRPSNELEQRSVTERILSMQVAWELMRTSPWQGVGIGKSGEAAFAVNPFAGAAHLVPLLVGAEIGVPGLLLWVLLLLAPLARKNLLQRYAPQTAVWLSIISFSMLQPEPTIFKLNAAVLLGMMAALWSRPESLTAESQD